MELRDYQQQAVRNVFAVWRNGSRRVCLVLPTGGGKTVIGSFVAAKARAGGKRSVWLTHTTDLVRQSTERVPCDYVDTIQACLKSGFPGGADVDLVFLDECHHFIAEEWQKVFEAYPNALFLGLTATPERADGRPLGDMFDTMVVGCSYSELVRRGVLVGCRVLRPEKELDRGIAMDPVEAYLERGEGRQGFIYCRSVELAEQVALKLHDAGVCAEPISDRTPVQQRKDYIGAFRSGRIRVLTNVYVLTEGIDVPQASLAIFARGFGHVSQMLQAAGRILRSAEGKRDALLIDLPGVTHQHGLPLEDREYSLQGEGIRRTAAGMSLRVCMHCGRTFEGDGACPGCGRENPKQAIKPPRIYNAALAEVYAGKETPAWVQRSEYDRLRDLARVRGYSDGWVAGEFRRLFGGDPRWLKDDNDGERKRSEYERLLKMAQSKGHNIGWAAQRYRLIYGAFPPRAWTP